jgi:predicted ArsR family transcriptional regulator
VLHAIERSSGATIQQLADVLGIVPVTVRSHVAALEAQGLVSAEDIRGRVGRPARCYVATDRARQRHGSRSGELVAELLRALESLAGNRGVDQLLDLAATRRTSENGVGPHAKLEERISTATQFLTDEGGDATCSESNSRRVIQDHRCPYLDAALATPAICRFHTQVVTRLLGAPAVLERAIARGDAVCEFVIRPAEPRMVDVRRLSDGRPAPG